ncbi:hypothetical protein CLV56_2869 [Mumia flava]|uniref:Uncharacterized protein n=1 Tax=Mumia flava TaxID=1348852 RepID=A0A2M9B607_9ACTN|nr:hypothetical protein CLV56_2869 [Mumia flava]
MSWLVVLGAVDGEPAQELAEWVRSDCLVSFGIAAWDRR